MFFHDLTTEEFRDRVGPEAVVFLPIGSVEEHGPHLPLNTDTVQPLYVVEKVAAMLEERGITTLVAPPIFYGNCVSTGKFPGSISITARTLGIMAGEILEEFVRNDLENIVVISGHAGRAHMQALRDASQELVSRHPALKLMCLSDYDLAYDILGKEVPGDDGHAGAVETARMMVIEPGLVKGTAKDNPVNWPRFRILPNAEKMFPSGVMGYPSLATRELGERVNEYIIEKLTGMVEEMVNEKQGE